MPIDIVLNEHSLHAPDAKTARASLIQLVETIRSASNLCNNTTVNLWIPTGVKCINLVRACGPSYTLKNFLGEPRLELNAPDLRRYLLTLLAKRNFWVDPLVPNLCNVLAVSFPSECCWKERSITLSGPAEPQTVFHASSSQDVDFLHMDGRIQY